MMAPTVWISRAAPSLIPFLALLMYGCMPAQGGWDFRDLSRRYPALERIQGQRLADALPYFLPDEQGLSLFLCRWPTREAVTVLLPEDASVDELRALRGALAAWQGADLGIRFRETRSSGAQIEFRLLEADDGAFDLARTGDTVVDCRVPSPSASGQPADRIDAEVVYASIFLRRANLDTLGRSQPLSIGRLAGEALHELGHALGFPGHAAIGRSVMVRTHEVVDHWGERVMDGEAFSDPTLKALYLVPSGAVIGRRSADPSASEDLQYFSASAEQGDWRGPYVRVGEKVAELFWRHRSRGRAVFRVGDWRSVMKKRDRIEFVPNAEAETVLAERPRPTQH